MHPVKHNCDRGIALDVNNVITEGKEIESVCVCVFCYVRHLGLNRIPHWNGIDQKKVRQGY